MKVYNKKWEKLRKAVLTRDGYMSQLSKRYGRCVQAEVVHHILPIESFPEYKYVSWNLVSVTNKEHNELHDRTTHRLTDKGMELVTRLAVKRGMDIERIKRRLSE